MSEIYDFLLHVVLTAPLGIKACLLGWIMSITLTQPLKFLLPLGWHPALRERIARAVAFGSAFLTVVVVEPNRTGVAWGFITGVWSPTFYWLLLLWLGGRSWPWAQKARDILSGDVRGTLLGSPQENRK